MILKVQRAHRMANPTSYPDLTNIFQGRNHILFECSRYAHPRMWFHSHAAFSSHPSNLPLLLTWLSLNPDAFTFDDVPPDPT